MPKTRGGKSTNLQRAVIPVRNTNPMKPLKKNAAGKKILQAKLDELKLRQQEELKQLERDVMMSNDADEPEDMNNYDQYNSSDLLDNFEKENEEHLEEVEEIEEEEEVEEEKEEEGVEEGEDISNDGFLKSKLGNQKDNADDITVEVIRRLDKLSNQMTQLQNSFEEWKETVEPFLDVNLLQSDNVPEFLPFQYVEDLVDFEQANDRDRLQLIKFFKKFCGPSEQASANGMMIAAFGPDEYITPYVTTEGKGVLHPDNLPPMIKTKLAQCVRNAMSLKTNTYFKAPDNDKFKEYFDEALKVVKNRRTRREKLGEIPAIDKKKSPVKRPRRRENEN